MKSPPRKPPNLKEKLASALLQMKRPDDHGQLVNVIDFDDAKAMSADQIISKFDFDHVVFHAIGGTTHPSNLVPRIRADHRQKTAKIDMPAIAKGKRIEKDQREFRERVLAKGSDVAKCQPKDKWKSQAMPGTKASGLKKSFGGKVSKR